MSPDENSNFDELLRSALSEEAETIVPAGDGLARIQQRVQERGSKMRWMRPALALGSVATLALIGVGAAALVNTSGNGKDTVKPGQTPTAQPTDTSSTALVNNTPPFPPEAIFPFTTATAEQGWQQDYDNGGGTQWETDPTQVAMHWVQDFLDQPTVDRVVSQSDDNGDKLVTLGRVLQAESHAIISVTTVRMTPYREAWVVTGASDPQNLLSFSTPTPGATIRTPVTVAGPAFGVDTAVKLDIRDATSTTSYGTATASFGNGTGQWQQPINFNRATSPIGALVAIDFSLADGGPTRIVAQQVRFAPAAANQPPPYFYAIKNDRITKFASRTGQSIAYLTTEQPGGGLSDPQLYGNDVYYVQGAGTCANALMKVSTSTDGAANGDIVTSSDNGYVISKYAMGETGISVFETACDPARSPQGKLVTTPTVSGPHSHTINFDAFPPVLETDPSYDVTGGSQLVTAIVKTGTQSSLVRYDIFGDTSPTPDRAACKGLGPEDGEPMAVEIDSTGTDWIALRTGSEMDVVRCSPADGKPKLAFTIPGNDVPADVDVTSDGSAVLLTDDNGKVWRWDGSGNPTELSNDLPLTNVTW